MIWPRNGLDTGHQRRGYPVDDGLQALASARGTDRHEEEREGADARMLERVGLLRELRVAVTLEDERERLADVARQPRRRDELDVERRRLRPVDPEGAADERDVRREPQVARPAHRAAGWRSCGIRRRGAGALERACRR